MAAKLEDIARVVGVSSSTISRALSGKSSVEPALMQQIVAAAELLGYPLDRYTSSVSKSKLIGVVVPNIASPFFSVLIEGIEQAAADHDYNVLLCNSNYDVALEMQCLEILADKNVAGILMSPVATHSKLPKSILMRSLPVVQVDRDSDELKCDLVQTDSFRGAHEAVKVLVGEGYRKIAIISGPKTHSTGKERLDGYLSTLREANLCVPPGYIEVVDFLEQDGYEATLRLLTIDPPPDAVFVTNVDMTIGALRAIHECAIRIPEEMGIIGFDEFPFASILAPPLTTVEQPIEMLAFTAVDLLMRRIQNRTTADPVTIKLSPKLNLRKSTRRQTEPAWQTEPARHLDPEKPGSGVMCG